MQDNRAGRVAMEFGKGESDFVRRKGGKKHEFDGVRLFSGLLSKKGTRLQSFEGKQETLHSIMHKSLDLF
jgi:hypothetical protein